MLVQLASSRIVRQVETEGTPSETVTGLDFPGNPVSAPRDTTDDYGLVWRDSVSTAPMVWTGGMTFIQKVYPRSQDYGYYSGLFYSQWMTSWDPTGLKYLGCHPYPENAETTWTPYYWEISNSGVDNIEDDSGDPAYGHLPTTGWDRWYTQVTIVNGNDIKFYWDYETSTARLIDTDNDSGNYGNNPSDPAIIVGFAPWNAGNEVYKGVIRGMQFYDAALTLAQVDDELASPGSFRTPWYLKLNPTPDDVADDSGNGNDPAWHNSNRPTLWTE